VALAPFSRWPTKNWPLRQFSEMARGLSHRIPTTFFLIGGPADRDAAREWTRLASGIRTVPCCGDMTLVETGSLMQEMDLAITVDSGPMHMAAALGVPVLALFGPTDPARTGPYGPNHRVLWVNGLPCRPCFSDTCSRDDHACMARLYPSQAVELAAEMLKFVPRDRVSF
jgi:ADP-heptose:LPS heptosyltransferase